MHVNRESIISMSSCVMVGPGVMFYSACCTCGYL